MSSCNFKTGFARIAEFPASRRHFASMPVGLRFPCCLSALLFPTPPIYFLCDSAVLYRSSLFKVLCVPTVLCSKVTMLSTFRRLVCRQYNFLLITYFWPVNAQQNTWIYPEPNTYHFFNVMDTVNASWYIQSNSTPLYLILWCSHHMTDTGVEGKMLG